jgi:hypothetical protein
MIHLPISDAALRRTAFINRKYAAKLPAILSGSLVIFSGEAAPAVLEEFCGVALPFL